MAPRRRALIGLQFVVIAPLTEVKRRSTMNEIDALGTPTILHFGAALLIAAILSAPWPSLVSAAVALGISGFLGVGYALIVLRRARRQSAYQPVLEDCIWHVILPLVACAVLSTAAVTLVRHAVVSLFFVGRDGAAAPVHRHPQPVGHRHLLRVGRDRSGADDKPSSE